MKTWVRRSLNVGVLGAGFLLVSGTAAQADQVSGPNAGIASGNQLSSVLQLPIDISGNAVSVLGFADAASVGGAGAFNTESAPVTEAGQVTGFNSGILSGNQVSSVVQVPVSVCGNSVAVLGFANASCVGGAGAVNGGGGWSNGGWDNDNDGDGQGSGGYADADDYGDGGGRGNDYDENSRNRGMGAGARNMGGGGALSNGGADQVTGYNAGLLSGNQVSSVIQAPIDVSGNAIALFGFASASSVGGAGAKNESAPVTEAGQVSGFNAGFLTGNQISSVVQVPISVCGNSIAILGFADASCVGGAGAVNGGGGWDNGGSDDDDNDGGADPTGDYDYADPAGGRPMSSGHGAHGASKHAKKAAKKAKHGNEHGNWGGRGHHGNGNGAGASDDGYGGSGSGGYNGGGAGSGNGGNGGNGNGGSWGGNGGSCGPDQITGFNSGILSGNQFSNVVQVPIDISGNAISVLGFASASSVGGAAAVNC
jgi:hypothetical protein